jgi:cardiolipin synthase
VDGYLAKRFDWGSRLGAFLDPVADKVLVAGSFVTLAVTGHVPIWLAAVVILRDVVILGGALAYSVFVAPVEVGPTRISKLNTALELLFVLFVLSRAAFDWPADITVTMLGAAVLVTVVVSGIDYVWTWTLRASEGRR